MTHDDPRVQRVITLFEELSPADLPRLGEVYAPDAVFKDPFNEVQGIPAITGVFAHMYEALQEPRFVVNTALVQGNEAFLAWDFLFRFRRYSDASQTVRGATHIRFAPDGRVSLHRDYWDAAEELYEKLPAVGALMRWLKRRANS